MATFPIYRLLDQHTNTQILEILNVTRFYQEIKSEFPHEYWLDCNFILEALDIASNISETNLARAPFPGIDITDTQADKAVKIADTWLKYPKVGLQLYLDPGIGRWIQKGQPIVLQNTPVQFPIPIISPYLNATSAVFLLGKTSRLGIKVVDGGNWQSIKGQDYITISGALRVDIQPKELKSVNIRNWLSISRIIPSNQPFRVLTAKSNRRFLSVQNAGNGNLFCGFGNDIGNNKGNLLMPGGSFNLDSERYYTESELWAFSPQADGLLVGQEGLF